jgi:hypothetical protein
VDSLPEPLPEVVAKAIDSSFKLLPKGSDLKKYNDEYFSKHKDSPAHVRSALYVRQQLDSNSISQNEKDLQSTLSSQKLTLEDIQESLKLLDEWNSSANVKRAFVETARKTWPDATILKS